MYLLYIFCFIPILVTYILKLVYNTEISWKEWLVTVPLNFIIALIIHQWAYHGQVGDHETWSGKIVMAKHFSAWKEQYEEAIYRTENYTDSNGITQLRTVFSHWETRTKWHPEYWQAYSNIDTEYDISSVKYRYFVKMFDNERKVSGVRRTSETSSHMIAGDAYDYETHLVSGFIEPITIVRYFENRIKATPSVFNFVKVPNEIKINDYPANDNVWTSDRVIGNARNKISIRLWDEMNARLGPAKRVNVIIIGFTGTDSMLAEWQRSHWLGGKKNDLVLCYGDNWSNVFGWSESDICKKNLETILLQNTKDNTIIPLIEKEIIKNYKKREFTEDFAYLTIEPQLKHWLTFIVLLVIVQGSAMTYLRNNQLF